MLQISCLESRNADVRRIVMLTPVMERLCRTELYVDFSKAIQIPNVREEGEHRRSLDSDIAFA